MTEKRTFDGITFMLGDKVRVGVLNPATSFASSRPVTRRPSAIPILGRLTLEADPPEDLCTWGQTEFSRTEIPKRG